MSPLVTDRYGVQMSPLVTDRYEVQMSPLVTDPYGVQMSPLVTDRYGVQMSPLVTDRYRVQMSPTWSLWSSDFRESEGCWLATKCEISDLSLSIRNGEAKRCYLGEARSLL